MDIVKLMLECAGGALSIYYSKESHECWLAQEKKGSELRLCAVKDLASNSSVVNKLLVLQFVKESSPVAIREAGRLNVYGSNACFKLGYSSPSLMLISSVPKLLENSLAENKEELVRVLKEDFDICSCEVEMFVVHERGGKSVYKAAESSQAWRSWADNHKQDHSDL